MTRDEVRPFVDRDWSLALRAKARYWVDRKRTMSPEEALAVGDRLRRHAQSLRPDWPSEEDRQRDLDVHSRVSESLRRVSLPSAR